jgi:hypothetical protein
MPRGIRVMLKICGTAIVILGLSVSAQAGRISGNSSYGGNFSSTAGACTSSSTDSFTDGSATFSYNCDLVGSTTIQAEAFLNSADALNAAINGGDLVVFDFQVTNAPAGMDLVLTPNGAPIYVEPSDSLPDLGLFVCSPGIPLPTDPQCIPATTDLSGVDTGSLVGSNAVFATSSSTLTYYVVLQDPCEPASTTCVSASVNASFEPASTATPEPRLLPILGLALLAGLLIYRRRLA